VTDLDEHLLTASKLREVARGRIESDDRILPLTAVVSDHADMASLAFLDNMDWDLPDSDGVPLDYEDTAHGRAVVRPLATKAATDRLDRGDVMGIASTVGVTEQDLDASSLTLPMRLLDRLDNHGAPAFVTLAGNPNTGKTNSMSLLVELRRADLDDLLVLSNCRTWEQTDVLTTSAHDLAVALLEHRDVPKVVAIDEGSTHFDARTNRREVATQWTPLAKRFAKVGVDTCCVVLHTGKDGHPELKSLTTTAIWKPNKTTAEVFDTWPRDSDRPTDRLFGGALNDLEPTSSAYSPDEPAPWSWNLRPDLFTSDLDWPDLLEALREAGPHPDT
jgi:hypothetical protein